MECNNCLKLTKDIGNMNSDFLTIKEKIVQTNKFITRYVTMEQDFNEEKKKNQVLIQQRNTLQAENNHLQGQYKEALLVSQPLKSENEKLSREYEKYFSKCQRLQEKLACSDALQKEKEKETRNFSQKYEQEKTEHKSTIAQLKDSEAHIITLQKSIKRLENDLHLSKDTCSKLRCQLTELRSQNGRLEKRMNAAENSLKERGVADLVPKKRFVSKLKHESKLEVENEYANEAHNSASRGFSVPIRRLISESALSSEDEDATCRNLNTLRNPLPPPLSPMPDSPPPAELEHMDTSLDEAADMLEERFMDATNSSDAESEAEAESTNTKMPFTAEQYSEDIKGNDPSSSIEVKVFGRKSHEPPDNNEDITQTESGSSDQNRSEVENISTRETSPLINASIPNEKPEVDEKSAGDSSGQSEESMSNESSAIGAQNHDTTAREIVRRFSLEAANPINLDAEEFQLPDEMKSTDCLENSRKIYQQIFADLAEIPKLGLKEHFCLPEEYTALLLEKQQNIHDHDVINVIKPVAKTVGTVDDKDGNLGLIKNESAANDVISTTLPVESTSGHAPHLEGEQNGSAANDVISATLPVESTSCHDPPTEGEDKLSVVDVHDVIGDISDLSSDNEDDDVIMVITPSQKVHAKETSLLKKENKEISDSRKMRQTRSTARCADEPIPLRQRGRSKVVARSRKPEVKVTNESSTEVEDCVEDCEVVGVSLDAAKRRRIAHIPANHSTVEVAAVESKVVEVSPNNNKVVDRSANTLEAVEPKEVSANDHQAVEPAANESNPVDVSANENKPREVSANDNQAVELVANESKIVEVTDSENKEDEVSTSNSQGTEQKVGRNGGENQLDKNTTDANSIVTETSKESINTETVCKQKPDDVNDVTRGLTEVNECAVVDENTNPVASDIRNEKPSESHAKDNANVDGGQPSPLPKTKVDKTETVKSSDKLAGTQCHNTEKYTELSARTPGAEIGSNTRKVTKLTSGKANRKRNLPRGNLPDLSAVKRRASCDSKSEINTGDNCQDMNTVDKKSSPIPTEAKPPSPITTEEKPPSPITTVVKPPSPKPETREERLERLVKITATKMSTLRRSGRHAKLLPVQSRVTPTAITRGRKGKKVGQPEVVGIENFKKARMEMQARQNQHGADLTSRVQHGRRSPPPRDPESKAVAQIYDKDVKMEEEENEKDGECGGSAEENSDGDDEQEDAADAADPASLATVLATLMQSNSPPIENTVSQIAELNPGILELRKELCLHLDKWHLFESVKRIRTQLEKAPKEPVLDVVETRTLELIQALTSTYPDLVLSMTSSGWWLPKQLISEGKIPAGIYSVIRIQVALCRLQGDLETARLLLLDAAGDLEGRDLLLLVLNVIVTWPEIGRTESPFVDVIKYFAGSCENCDVMNDVRFCLNAVHWPLPDVTISKDELVNSLLDKLQNRDIDEEEVTELRAAILFFCRKQNWQWVHDTVITDLLWPDMQKYAEENGGIHGSAEKLTLIGQLCSCCPSSDNRPVHAVLNLVTSVLDAARKKLDINMQMSAAHAILYILPHFPDESEKFARLVTALRDFWTEFDFEGKIKVAVKVYGERSVLKNLL